MSRATVYIRLMNTASAQALRAPNLERLLTQASAAATSTDWRGDAFEVIAGGAAVPPVAAVALEAALRASPVVLAGRWVCVASPVHLVAGMTNVTLPGHGVLRLAPAESAALAADFNQVFGDSDVRLLAGAGAVLLCVFARTLNVRTHDPLDALERDVFGFQPTGDDAAPLRRLMSEMELWLFEHAVNRARAARGEPVVTGLWLWGGGEPLSAAPTVRGWTAGNDPLFAAFGAAAAFPTGATPGSGVLVCDIAPGSPEWPEVEQRWLRPAAAALRAGELDRLTLSAARRVVSIEKGLPWRFWRRPRPWWLSFEPLRDAAAADESEKE